MIDTALLPDDAPFALAFSGGGDSLALLKYLKDHPALRAVIHVDHNLRETSDAEAEQAAKLAKSLGHDLMVLRWSPEAGLTGLQEKARRARYGLLGQACREKAIPSLVTAHHADDQAETVLMRLQRGSGWRGAAGMRPIRYAPVWPELAGIHLIRPALGLSRNDLRQDLGSLEPIEDPSNTNCNFARIRAREELSKNPDLRLDMLKLSSDMSEGLRQETDRIRDELRGYSLTHDGLFGVPRLIGEEALALIAPIIGGQSGPADRRRIAKKIAPLKVREAVSVGYGCMGQWDGEILTLFRDRVAVTGRRDRRLSPTAVPIHITPKPAVWDGRFLVSGTAGQLHPVERSKHVGYRVYAGRGTRVRNLVKERLEAALTGM